MLTEKTVAINLENHLVDNFCLKISLLRFILFLHLSISNVIMNIQWSKQPAHT